MSDLVEVLAHRLANQWLLDDQEKAIQGGCDVMLLIDPYLPKARVDVAFMLCSLEAAGYRVVPVKPTEAMCAEGAVSVSDYRPEWSSSAGIAHETWTAMLAASPVAK